MLVNRNKKIIFVRIPKTACTSIGVALLNSNQGWENIHCYINQSVNTYHLGTHALNNYSEFKDYEIVGVSRNPWERMVSMISFYWARTLEIIKNPMDWSDEDVSWGKQKNIQILNQGFKEFLKYDHEATRTCCSWISDEYSARWFRFEKLDELENYFEVELPVINATAHLKYTEYYDDEAIEIVRKIHEKDIIRFNYSYAQ